MNSTAQLVSPADTHNLELLAHLRPETYLNPVPQSKYNLVVIGGGTAGLVTAVGAAGLGAKVALVEKHLLGGDCLNVGCVPSKALLRSAKAAYEARRAAEFGVKVFSHQIDFPAVMERVRRLRAHIAPLDGIHSLTQKGVDVFLGKARFLDSSTVEVADRKLTFARAVIATGTSPAIPDIPGLKDCSPLTNESLFDLTELPPSLAVLGAGPVGCEMAQAFARLGSKVTLFELKDRLLPAEDPEASARLLESFTRDGITCHLGCANLSFSRAETGIVAACVLNGQKITVEVNQVLVAAGRTPNTGHMQLDKVGVHTTRDGIAVNEQLRTTNSRIFACGDVCSQYKFTHAADALARLVIGNALFFSSAKLSDLNIPYSVYTSPEVAHVGRHAHTAGNECSVIRFELTHLDRALLDGSPEGFVKILHDKQGRILGATIVSEHAGEHIAEFVLAMNHNISLSKLASDIHPYPTYSEMIKKCGDLYRRTLLTPTVANLLSSILKWRR